jgi:Bacterial Ig-like domain
MKKMNAIRFAANWLLVLAAAIFATGCGGGGGGGSTTASLSGTAAVGAPIASASVVVSCKTGTLARSKTDSAGNWNVTLADADFPCALQVTGGSVAGASATVAYHSIALSGGTANITPLTDLIVASLTGQTSPETWFAGLGSNRTGLAAVQQTDVDRAVAQLNSAFPELPLYGSGNHPVTSRFVATPGNSHDDMLSSLRTALTNTGITHAAILEKASGGFSTNLPDLVTAVKVAYQNSGTGKNAVYFPVDAVMTMFNVSSNSITLSGISANAGYMYWETDSLVEPGIFEGQKSYVVRASAYGSWDDGLHKIPSPVSTDYFRVGPFTNLGSTSEDSYTVYYNQIPLPQKAVIGSSGKLNDGVDYSDSSKVQTLARFTENWDLKQGPTANTASLCINNVADILGDRKTTTETVYCLVIDGTGNILSVQLDSKASGGVVAALSLRSTSITSVPLAVVSISAIGESARTDEPIVLTLNGLIDQKSPMPSLVQLTGPSGETVAGTVEIRANQLVFIPAKPLIKNANYIFSLSAGIKGMNGSSMEAGYVGQFKTELSPTGQ